MLYLDKHTLIEDLLDEREELLELIEELPPFVPQKNWHLSEQHVLMQCLIDVEKDLQQNLVVGIGAFERRVGFVLEVPSQLFAVGA